MRTERIYEDREVSQGALSRCEAVLSPQSSICQKIFQIVSHVAYNISPSVKLFHLFISNVNLVFELGNAFIEWTMLQGCINCSILPAGLGARGISSEHVENMENAFSNLGVLRFSENRAPTEMCSGSPT